MIFTRKLIYRISLALSAACFCLAAYSAHSYYQEKTRIIQQAKEAIKKEGIRIVDSINQELKKIYTNQVDLYNQMRNGKLPQIEKMVQSINLGKTGYGFITSGGGYILYHPNTSLVKEGKNIKTLAQQLEYNITIHDIDNILNNQAVFLEIKSIVNGQEQFLFFKQIPETKWILGIIVERSELELDNLYLKREFIKFDLQLILGFIFLFIALFRADTGYTFCLWLVSISTSLLLIISIGYIWYREIDHKNHMIFNQDNHVIVFTKGSANNFVNTKVKDNNLIKIPTGVFIQSIEFKAENDVYVTGYIWQKYDNDIKDKMDKGFILIEGQEMTINQVYTRSQDNQEVIGWYFEGLIRQNYNFAKYPFDHKNIYIRLWPKDFNRQIIFVPDFDSYSTLIPAKLPGIEPNIVLSGWDLDASYFSYQMVNYNTNFGNNNNTRLERFPQFSFNILLQRDWLMIIISDLMVPFIIAFILFFIQLVVIDKQSEGKATFSVTDLLSSSSSLLLIVVLAHVSLRSRVAVAGILYIEYMYLMLYIMIIWVIINGIIFLKRPNLILFQYKKNLIAKLFYWPIFLKVFLIITLIIFY